MDKIVLENLLGQIDARLINFKSKLKDKIDPRDVSSMAKIPFKILSIKEIYLHRTYDFAVSSRLLFSEKRLVPAILIVRSIMETNAIFYRINH